MNRSFVRRMVAGALVASAFVTAGGWNPAAAAPDSPKKPVSEPAEELLTTPVTDWSALEAALSKDGFVRVMVQLNVKAKPEHVLARDQLDRQRSAIATARRGVLEQELANRGVGAVRTSDEMPLIAMTVDRKALEKLRRSPRVVAVLEDREVEMAFPQGGDGEADQDVAGTSSNGYSTQLTPWWDRDRISVPAAQNAGWNGTGQSIAVLDTGVDRNHGWLSGRVVNEACFSSINTLTPGAPGGCPNGANQQFGLGAARPCAYAWDCAHGTHVAHTAGGMYGVANGSTILAVQVFHRGADGLPTYYESDLVWGLSHVYNIRGSYRIAAVNLSVGDHRQFGSTCDPYDDKTTPYLADWMRSLRGVGIASVVASGNDGYSGGINRPACITSAVAVGNTTYDPSGADAVYVTSNSHALVDLLAPGTDICSAVPVSLDREGSADGIACAWIGTSMASPHVAGAMAVLRQRRPAASVDQLVNALYYGGSSVYDSRNGVTRTRINVVGALNRI